MAMSVSSEQLALLSAQISHTIHYGEQISQLMHLGAIAFVLSAAYVGLDRIQEKREPFREQLKQSCLEAKKYLTRQDLKKAKWNTQKIFLTHPGFVLTRVAEPEIKLPLPWRIWHCFVRQYRLPLLNYIRFELDRRLTCLLCLMNLTAISIVAFAGMWPEHVQDFVTGRPVWFPIAGVAVGLGFWAFYWPRKAYETTKLAIKWFTYVMVVLTLAAVAWPTYARIPIDWSVWHANAFAFLLFTGTLIWILFTVACTERLRDASAVFSDYNDQMKSRFDEITASLVQSVDDQLDNNKPGKP
jgi:hypothetical protein